MSSTWPSQVSCGTQSHQDVCTEVSKSLICHAETLPKSGAVIWLCLKHHHWPLSAQSSSCTAQRATPPQKRADKALTAFWIQKSVTPEIAVVRHKSRLFSQKPIVWFITVEPGNYKLHVHVILSLSLHPCKRFWLMYSFSVIVLWSKMSTLIGINRLILQWI